MDKTNNMKKRAMEDKKNRCFWLKGIVPRGKIHFNEDEWVDYELCGPKVNGDFNKIPNEKAIAGTDGGEATDKVKTAIKVSAAAAVISEDV